VPTPPERLEGIVMGVNYGFEKVRFISPVKVGSKVRATSVLAAVEAKDANTLQVTRTITVDIEGEAKPALVADWIGRLDLRLTAGAARSAVEGRPAEVVAQPLVVQDELADRARELVALPPALQPPS
jgi:hypothetical protein